jgi:hypothetical protein
METTISASRRARLAGFECTAADFGSAVPSREFGDAIATRKGADAILKRPDPRPEPTRRAGVAVSGALR